MKTLHLYLIAIAATLAACSSDEAVAPATGDDVGGDDICFTTAVADATSRGTNVDLTTLQESGFWVKALKVDGTPLWSNTETDDMLKFVYDNSSQTFKPQVEEGKNFITKWPAGQTIWLYATNIDPTGTDGIKMSKQNGNNEAAYNGIIYSNISMNTDVTKQFDFVYASNYGMRSDFTNGAVPLYFRHAFTQVEIQAKNSNPAYTVKVKGYKLHYANIAGKFWFLDAVQYTTADALAAAMKEQDAAATDEAITAANTDDLKKQIVTYTKRHWSFNSENSFATYESGYKNGFTTTASGIYDDDEANHITLTSEPQTIGNGTDNNKMMIIPWGNYSHYGVAADGPYIALLVQIDFAAGETTGDSNQYGQKRSPLYPACRVPSTATDNNLETRVSYTGLPKYYGWIYVPYTFSADWQYYIGKKVTFVLDFTSGLGKVDMSKPVPVETETGYTADTGTGTALDATVDPYTAKQTVLGENVGVTTTVTAWDAASGYNPKTITP